MEGFKRTVRLNAQKTYIYLKKKDLNERTIQ